MSGLFERALEKLGDGEESHDRRKSPALPGAAADAAQESQAEQPIVDADVVGRAAGQPSPQPPATTESMA